MLMIGQDTLWIARDLAHFGNVLRPLKMMFTPMGAQWGSLPAFSGYARDSGCVFFGRTIVCAGWNS